ncbi:MAG TPA: glycosyltransferase family 2 protein [Thermoanaerobaculia bacterium]|nr:glycosyltransferase family 2 protein [Thermoanaerobaculia bacterium]
MDLSIIVPLYNEEESVDALYAEVRAAADGLGREWELLLVDDGSGDATPAKLRQLCARDPRVTAVRFRRNYGQTAALQAGFDHARGRVVVTLDGDLQNDPRDFGLLLAALDEGEGYDVVCGWRRDRKDRMLSRKVPSRAANWLIGALTGTSIHDNGCTLKAYRAEVVKRARLYAEMHRFLAPMMSLSGCRWKEVVVHHRARRFGRSKYGISRIWKVFLDLLTVKMLLGFTTRPAKWFAVLGVPFLAGTLLALAASAWVHLKWWPGSRYPLVFPAITILCALAWVHLTLVGLFSELVVKVGDFKAAEALLASPVSGGGHESPAALRPA